MHTPSFPMRLTLLAFCCSVGSPAWAASATASPQSGPMVLGETDISAHKTAPHDLPPVYAGGQVARGGQLGVLGNADLMDVPFTMSSYTEQLIEDQQAEDVGDVLFNDASVRQSSGYANASKIFVIRGLKLATDDISYNGLYGVLPRQIISTDALERVEVFKGPNAFINGVTPTGSGIGGGVNLQPKRAKDTPTRRFTTDISSDGRVGEHLDLGQRFGEGNQFGARLNLSQREGETGVEDEEHRSKLFALGLDYRGDDFRISGDFAYQKQRINQSRNAVFVASGLTRVPHAPDSDTNYAPNWTWTEIEDTFGMTRAEYDLNDDWTLYAAAGAKHTRENGIYGSPTIIDAAGNTTASPSSIPHDEDNKTAMAGINGKLQTGSVSHKVNFGLSGIWTEQRGAYLFGSTSGNNLYDPVSQERPALDSFTAGDMNDPGITGKSRMRSVAFSDTLGFFDDRLLLTAGLRRQQLQVQGYDYNSGSRNALYDQAITTPVYGVVFKPWEYVSFYANRIEGLAQGPTAPSTVTINPGQVFAPARSKQIEAGVKLDMGTFGTSLGVYRIEQPTDGYQIQDGLGTRYVRDGDQRNRGVEMNVFGEPVVGLRLLAGLTLMHTEVSGTSGGSDDGNRAIGVPTFQFNAGADWDVPGIEGAAISARMLRTGGQYVDAANTLSIPTWNRFDLGARYTFNVAQKDVTLRANVENLMDKDYWASANGGYLTQGEPRTLKLSGTIDF
ncbi:MULTISPECIES: TonB-dependent receptor [Pseudomonas syringae group]|uniref:TonB-dependent receptor n=1 Tax=Pseudomonas syringae group TaxID=136849 RepID=UPI000EFDF41D|nr:MULTISPECIES: TonB-dependent siderophore receptor [Pseudomonas syringae group]MCF5744681.1 TonB-dependent siderophore receptor [Pseudomonas tremae]RMP25435.1 TonB-dependent siderophore receptor [Pseudomonas coronafaciens pv. atropurpurea]UQB38738.1 TonB-dependent siderophore receptor [Pseudomonas tremae]